MVQKTVYLQDIALNDNSVFQYFLFKEVHGLYEFVLCIPRLSLSVELRFFDYLSTAEAVHDLAVVAQIDVTLQAL